MTAEEMKYSRIEYERRFLVSPDSGWRQNVEPYSKTLEDKYLSAGRLRLRVQTDNDSGRRLIKLTKKVESQSPFCTTINRILLTPEEHKLLAPLEGALLNKTRHYHTFRGQVFSIDVFEGELESLILCETESDGLESLMAISPPPYASREVTEDPFFTGGNLARASRTNLLERLSMLD